MSIRRQTAALAALLVPLLLLTDTTVHADPESTALRNRAYDLAYNLDQKEAFELFRRAVVRDGADPATHRSLAAMCWLDILFKRGTLTVDDYLGRVTKPTVAMAQPPRELASTFREHVDKAVALAEKRIAANSKDVAAHYELGASIGLLASYSASVEGSMMAAFRAARRAYDEHETVLDLDPRRKDAALVAGTYRYIVSTLAFPVRWMAYVAGFGGGRERGTRLIEEAAAMRSDAQTEARFALVLIYNRERRFDEALRVLRVLQQAYPRNRLLWLEAGATALRAGRAGEAENLLNDGMSRFEHDRRPRAFGELALWRYKRGAARVALGKRAAALADLQQALSDQTRDWIRGRIHIELGKLADAAGDRRRARTEYQAAMKLCGADNDPLGVAEARRLHDSGDGKRS